MKSITQIIITHALFILIFSFAGLALAQEEGDLTEDVAKAATNRVERQAEIQNNLQERRAEMQTSLEERRAQIEVHVQERITNLAANMSNRMDAAIERIQNIIDRIDTRIQKITESGVDTSEAKKALASAQLSVDAATNEIATIDDQVAIAIGSEDVRTAWKEVKETFMTVKHHLKTAHSELRITVAALKTAVAETEMSNGVSEAVTTSKTEVENNEQN